MGVGNGAALFAPDAIAGAAAGPGPRWAGARYCEGVASPANAKAETNNRRTIETARSPETRSRGRPAGAVTSRHLSEQFGAPDASGPFHNGARKGPVGGPSFPGLPSSHRRWEVKERA